MKPKKAGGILSSIIPKAPRHVNKFGELSIDCQTEAIEANKVSAGGFGSLTAAKAYRQNFGRRLSNSSAKQELAAQRSPGATTKGSGTAVGDKASLEQTDRRSFLNVAKAMSKGTAKTKSMYNVSDALWSTYHVGTFRKKFRLGIKKSLKQDDWNELQCSFKFILSEISQLEGQKDLTEDLDLTEIKEDVEGGSLRVRQLCEATRTFEHRFALIKCLRSEQRYPELESSVLAAKEFLEKIEGSAAELRELLGKMLRPSVAQTMNEEAHADQFLSGLNQDSISFLESLALDEDEKADVELERQLAYKGALAKDVPAFRAVVSERAWAKIIQDRVQTLHEQACECHEAHQLRQCIEEEEATLEILKREAGLKEIAAAAASTPKLSSANDATSPLSRSVPSRCEEPPTPPVAKPALLHPRAAAPPAAAAPSSKQNLNETGSDAEANREVELDSLPDKIHVDFDLVTQPTKSYPSRDKYSSNESVRSTGGKCEAWRPATRPSLESCDPRSPLRDTGEPVTVLLSREQPSRAGMKNLPQAGSCPSNGYMHGFGLPGIPQKWRSPQLDMPQTWSRVATVRNSDAEGHIEEEPLSSQTLGQLILQRKACTDQAAAAKRAGTERSLIGEQSTARPACNSDAESHIAQQTLSIDNNNTVGQLFNHTVGQLVLQKNPSVDQAAYGKRLGAVGSSTARPDHVVSGKSLATVGSLTARPAAPAVLQNAKVAKAAGKALLLKSIPNRRVSDSLLLLKGSRDLPNLRLHEAMNDFKNLVTVAPGELQSMDPSAESQEQVSTTCNKGCDDEDGRHLSGFGSDSDDQDTGANLKQVASKKTIANLSQLAKKEQLSLTDGTIGLALQEIQDIVVNKWGSFEKASQAIGSLNGGAWPIQMERIHAILRTHGLWRSSSELCVVFQALGVPCAENSNAALDDFMRLQDYTYFKNGNTEKTYYNQLLNILQLRRLLTESLTAGERYFAEVLLATKSLSSESLKYALKNCDLALQARTDHASSTSKVLLSADGLQVFLDIIKASHQPIDVRVLATAILCSAVRVSRLADAHVHETSEGAQSAFQAFSSVPKIGCKGCIRKGKGQCCSKCIASRRAKMPPLVADADRGCSTNNFDRYLMSQIWRPLMELIDPGLDLATTAPEAKLLEDILLKEIYTLFQEIRVATLVLGASTSLPLVDQVVANLDQLRGAASPISALRTIKPLEPGGVPSSVQILTAAFGGHCLVQHLLCEGSDQVREIAKPAYEALCVARRKLLLRWLTPKGEQSVSSGQYIAKVEALGRVREIAQANGFPEKPLAIMSPGSLVACGEIRLPRAPPSGNGAQSPANKRAAPKPVPRSQNFKSSAHGMVAEAQELGLQSTDVMVGRRVSV